MLKSRLGGKITQISQNRSSVLALFSQNISELTKNEFMSPSSLLFLFLFRNIYEYIHEIFSSTAPLFVSSEQEEHHEHHRQHNREDHVRFVSQKKK